MRWMRTLLIFCILLVQLTNASALELLCTDQRNVQNSMQHDAGESQSAQH